MLAKRLKCLLRGGCSWLYCGKCRRCGSVRELGHVLDKSTKCIYCGRVFCERVFNHVTGNLAGDPYEGDVCKDYRDHDWVVFKEGLDLISQGTDKDGLPVADLLTESICTKCGKISEYRAGGF